MKPIRNVLTIVALSAIIVSCAKKNDRINGEESVAIAKEANDSTFNDRKEEKDADFVVNAIAATYAEIKIAQLAHNKSADQKVKALATEFENEHMTILNGLKAVADRKGIAVPLEESSADAKVFQKLDECPADKFDKEWYDAMKGKHEKLISQFEMRRGRTDDAELAKWIDETLPKLKSHVEDIRQTR